jgi:hypothetical protein
MKAICTARFLVVVALSLASREQQFQDDACAHGQLGPLLRKEKGPLQWAVKALARRI